MGAHLVHTWSGLCRAAGADDGTVRVWDGRKLANAEGSGGTPNRHPGLLYELKGHSEDVLRLEWCPHAKVGVGEGADSSKEGGHGACNLRPRCKCWPSEDWLRSRLRHGQQAAAVVCGCVL